jgi:hypothetical protein
VLAVLDWELSTLGEDFKYYAIILIRFSDLQVSYILSLKALNYTAILEDLPIIVESRDPNFDTKIEFSTQMNNLISTNMIDFGKFVFCFYCYFDQNLFRAGDPLSDIAYMCLAHYIPTDSPMLR